MKTNMKKLAAWMLALLLVFQMIPAVADGETDGESISNIIEGSSPDALRTKLEVKSPQKFIKIGETYEMEYSSDYTLKWSSSDETIATVDEDGVVTPLSTGTVTITAAEQNRDTTYTDSVKLRVIAGTEKAEGTEETAEEPEEDVYILISGDHQTYTYNGEEQTAGYSITANGPYDEDKLSIINDRTAKAKDCGVYPIKFEDGDFIYDTNGDGQNDATIEYSNGWMKINRAEATLTINDVTVKEGETPEFTATVDGLFGEDRIDYELTTLEQDGVKYIVPSENISEKGNYRVTVTKGILTVEAVDGISGSYVLGTLNVNGNALLTATERTDNRLAGAKYREVGDGLIETDLETVDYWKFEKQSDGTYYISSNGKYLFIDGTSKKVKMRSTPQPLIVTVMPNGRIGIKNSNNFALNLKSHNATNGFQGAASNGDPASNEQFVLYRGKREEVRIEPVEQDLYNFLIINGTYYRLKKTTVVAAPLEDVLDEVLKSGDSKAATKKHVLKCNPEEYDFNGVVLNLNGKKYVYRNNSYVAPEKFVSYYTVTYESVDIPKSRLMNKDPNWYKDPKGWLDGPAWDVPNNTDAYHRNYTATLHEGNLEYYTISFQGTEEAIDEINEAEGTLITLPAPTKEGFTFAGWNTVSDGTGTAYPANSEFEIAEDVTLYAQWTEQTIEDGLTVYIRSNWPENKPAFFGTEIVLTAYVDGAEEGEYTLSWQRTKTPELNESWVTIPDAHERTIKFILSEETVGYTWRAVANKIQE